MILPAELSRQPTVLVVEDDDPTLYAMTRALVGEGYMTLTAPNVHAALGTVYKPLQPIDVVLLDVHLPDVSGIDFCARLRERHPDMPVIVCTGEADTDEMGKLQELGISRVLRKPIAMKELLATVAAALGGSNNR